MNKDVFVITNENWDAVYAEYQRLEAENKELREALVGARVIAKCIADTLPSKSHRQHLFDSTGNANIRYQQNYRWQLGELGEKIVKTIDAALTAGK